MPITLEDIQAFIYRGEVANYSALPSAASVPNAFYWVKASQGTKFIGVLWGGSYYPAGTYHSNGTSWEYMDTPSQATQAEVDAGTITDKWVSPNTLKNGSQWATKEDKGDYQIKAVAYILLTTDSTVEVTASGATQTLYTAVGNLNKKCRIINASNGVVRADTTLSQTIGNKVIGNPIFIDLQPEEWLDVISNGTNWRII